MRANDGEIFAKSRVITLLLFLFFAFSAEATDHYCWSDTIIIGGKRLIVEREVSYDTLNTTANQPEAEKAVRKRLSLGSLRLGFTGTGYVPLDQISAEVPGFSSVNAFTGPDRRPGSGMGTEVYMERQLGNSGWYAHTGVGMDVMTGFHLSFDTAVVDENLFAFASFSKNELDQILLYTYDIGSETDTIAINLSQEGFKSSWLRVPVGVVFEREASASFVWRMGLFADLRLNLSGTTPDIVLIADRGGEMHFVDAELNSWKYRSFMVNPRLSLGGRWEMDRRWWLITQVEVAFPFSPIESEGAGFEYSGLLVNAGVGVQYLFGR